MVLARVECNSPNSPAAGGPSGKLPERVILTTTGVLASAFFCLGAACFFSTLAFGAAFAWGFSALAAAGLAFSTGGAARRTAV